MLETRILRGNPQLHDHAILQSPEESYQSLDQRARGDQQEEASLNVGYATQKDDVKAVANSKVGAAAHATPVVQRGSPDSGFKDEEALYLFNLTAKIHLQSATRMFSHLYM